MPEHAHLVVYPTEWPYDIARIRKAIKAPVAAKALTHLEQYSPHWIAKITRHRGGKTERLFWQSGGGYDRNITSGKTLQKMIDYIHQNPARLGLVERATEWKWWSSAAWFNGGGTPILMPDKRPADWLD